MRAKSLACTVLLIAVFASSATLAQGVASGIAPGIELARNLTAEARAAAQQGKPLLLFVTQPGCTYCERARREYLRHLAVDPAYTSRVLIRELSIDRYVTGFNGRRISGAEVAHGLKVKLYPTIVVVDATGEAIAAPLVGFTVPDFYAAQIDGRIDEAEAKLAARKKTTDATALTIALRIPAPSIQNGSKD
jgi:thioredoxin-related protein